MPHQTLRIRGLVRVRVYGPDGSLKHDVTTRNLITQVGDQLYLERGAGVGSLDAPTGMRLGTDDTAPAKTGAGAAIGAYVSGSAKELDAPASSSLVSGARVITYEVTWLPGEGSALGIAEVALTNEAPLSDDGGSEADTVARALLSPPVDKGASDTLRVSWQHSGEGA